MSEHPDVVTNLPDIPWRQMSGTRNRMAHGYFDIKLEIVWDTVQTSSPELERQLKNVKARSDR
jgi:uncharacterized protein with HEPN domain